MIRNTLGLALEILLLMGCSRPPIEIPTGTFYGTLPCADCSGIRYELTLGDEGAYVQSSQYLGKSTTVLVDSGTYSVEQDSILRLDGSSDAGMNRWVVAGGTLRMLDQSGAAIESDLADRYVLSSERPNESPDAAPLEADFKATGNEPFWSLTIDFNRQMRLKTLNGLEIITPVPEVTYPQEGMTEWNAATEAGELVVTVTRAKCQDTMSGDSSDYQVQVRVVVGNKGEKTYLGCGNYQGNYRLNNRWLLSSVNGKPTDAGSEAPYLKFQLAENRVSGFGGCNRFTGSVDLKDSTLEFGALASTKMACPTLNDEATFLRALSEQRLSFRIAERQLRLSNDSTTLVFSAAN